MLRGEKRRGRVDGRGGDGVQRMQRQTWKMGRLLTSQRDKVKREEADFDSFPGLHQQNGC